jgi:hypothetical protein
VNPILACPFPPCTAHIEPVTHRTDPADPSKTVLVVPMHDVQGPAGWFGRCPASMFIVPELTDAAKSVLAESLKTFASMFAHRITRESEDWQPAPEGGIKPREAPGSGVRGLRPPVEAIETEAFFPIRPAETEEYEPTPNRGARHVASRDELVAMVSAAIDAAGTAQESAAILTNAVDDAERAIERLAEQQQIGAAMTVAGIGGADVGSVPQPAQDMLSSFSRLGELIIELRGQVNLARSRNEGVFRVAGRAADAGQTYIRQI